MDSLMYKIQSQPGHYTSDFLDFYLNKLCKTLCVLILYSLKAEIANSLAAFNSKLKLSNSLTTLGAICHQKPKNSSMLIFFSLKKKGILSKIIISQLQKK